MKKTLFSLVLMFLCVAMVMTSCNFGKQDDGNKVVEDTPEVKADKETIVGVVSGTKLGDVFADIKEIALPEMEEVEAIYNEAISSVEGIKAQAEVSVPENADFKGVIANGGAFIYANEELGAAIIMAGEQLYAISQSQYGFSVEATPIAMPEVSDEEFAAAIDEYLEQIKYYVDIIDGITIPSLTSSLITKNGDWYMLNREFTRNMIKSYIVGFATAEGETVDAEGLASLDEMLAKVNVDLGFAVSGDKIRGVKIDAEISDEYETYPNGYDAEPVMEKNTVKINFEALLTADLKGLDRVAAGLVQDENSASAAIDLNETNVKIDFDYNTEYQTIDASATIDFDADAVAVNSIAADFAIKTEFSNVEATATLNFDNITKANADVVVFDLDFYDENTHGTIDAYIKNDAEGNGVVYAKIATDGVTDMEITGAIDYDNATDIPADDDFVFTLVENYDLYDAKAWEIYNAFMTYAEGNIENPGNYRIAYYDADLGVTIVASIYVDGTYEYTYDEYGNVIDKQFIIINNLDPMRIYVSQGEFTPEYYDFAATVDQGEFVFTVHENVNDDTNNDVVGDIVVGNEESKDFE